MSLQNRTASELVPSSEMKSFMDELARVTDRESFNSLMKRFDESFMQRYQNSNKQDRGKFPFGSSSEPILPKTAPPVQVPYSNLGSFYPQDQMKFQGEPRINRYPQEMPYSTIPPNYQHEPVPYPNKYIEDPYGVPMYNRGFLPESRGVPNYPRNEPFERGFIKNEPYEPQYRNENFEKIHQGYGREQFLPQYSNSAYGGFGNPQAYRNPVQESIDLRRVKEDLLMQSKNVENKIIEQINLPPPRYENYGNNPNQAFGNNINTGYGHPNLENPSGYPSQGYKSFYSKN